MWAAERNAKLWAQQALRRRGARTPEFYFPKHFDNSRLVKAPDPVRVREMRLFSAAVAILFSLVMVYGLQHFYAIENGYSVESDKQVLDQLRPGGSSQCWLRCWRACDCPANSSGVEEQLLAPSL
jgi:hypothetical protein